MRDSDEKYDMPDEISDMTLLKTLGHSELTAVGLFISIVVIFVVPGLSLTAFVTKGKFASIQTAGRAGVTTGVAFVVGHIVDFIKMKRDDSPFDQLGMGFILFTAVRIFILTIGPVVQNTVDRIEAESKASDFDAAAVHGQGPTSEADQFESQSALMRNTTYNRRRPECRTQRRGIRACGIPLPEVERSPGFAVITRVSCR